MSVDLLKPENYVKFTWPVQLIPHTTELYSDQFKIDNLENVVFNIGMKFNDTSATPSCLWVRKSSSEVARATINLSLGKVKSTVKVRDWKDYCYFKSIKIPEKPSVQKFCLDCRSICNINEIILECEIFWKGYVKKPPCNNFFDEVKNFYNPQDLSDVTLVVGGVEIPSHKNILSQSDVISKMLQSEFKDKENVINITDLDADEILEMLHFFYKGTSKASHDTEIALQMLEISDIYQIKKLKELCESTLLTNMSVDNIVDIIKAADDHHALGLVKSAVNFIASNYDKITSTSNSIELFEKKPLLMYQVMEILIEKKRPVL